jgi:hypothetical protein
MICDCFTRFLYFLYFIRRLSDHQRSQEPSKCTWPGWTMDAFRDWGMYIRMAVPSCVMICEYAGVRGSTIPETFQV